jgi:hypothetical protein
LAQFGNDKGKEGVILLKCLFQSLPKISIILIVVDGNRTGYPIGFDMADTVDGTHNSSNLRAPRIISFSFGYLKPNASRNMMQGFDAISHKYGARDLSIWLPFRLSISSTVPAPFLLKMMRYNSVTKIVIAVNGIDLK